MRLGRLSYTLALMLRSGSLVPYAFPLCLSSLDHSRRRSRTSRSPSPPPRVIASPTSLGRNTMPLGHKHGKDEGVGGHKSLGGFSVKTAVEESYRPQESEVYGAHVPLLERAARLQCVAMLSLVAGGEDDKVSGGGSGSGGENGMGYIVIMG